MSRRWIVLPALAVVAVALALFLPFLLGSRELVASTPSPRPLFDVAFVELPPTYTLCLSDVTIPADARQLRFQVRTYGQPGPALAVSLHAPGYTERIRVADGYVDGTLLSPAFTPPAADALGRVCIAPEGTQRIGLVGSTEPRTRSRPEGRIGDIDVPADTYLAFYEGQTGTPAGRVAAIVERMGAFRPGIVGPWLLWFLLVLAVLGVPAGVVAAVLLGGARQGR